MTAIERSHSIWIYLFKVKPIKISMIFSEELKYLLSLFNLQGRQFIWQVMTVSPYQLSMEGIPVTRCVQNPGQYVIIFPGSYYSAFDCGYNCLEKANFAPLDWLPHGEIAVLQNQEKSKKSLLPYDKLLLTAASEAAKCLKEYAFSKRKTAWYMTWNDSCGKDGLLSNIVKVCAPLFFACLFLRLCTKTM